MLIIEFTANGKVKLEVGKIRDARIVGKALNSAGIKYSAFELSQIDLGKADEEQGEKQPEKQPELPAA
jgi:hypothetical protein